jgi:hypothetical protein
MMIIANMTAYSTAVGPSSSRRSRRSIFMWVSLQVKLKSLGALNRQGWTIFAPCPLEVYVRNPLG